MQFSNSSLHFRQASEEFQILANSYWYSSQRGPALYMAMVDYDDAMEAFQSVSVAAPQVAQSAEDSSARLTLKSLDPGFNRWKMSLI